MQRSNSAELWTALEGFQSTLEATVEPGHYQGWKGKFLRDFARLRTALAQRPDRRPVRPVGSCSTRPAPERDLAEFCDLIQTQIAAFAIGETETTRDDPNIARNLDDRLEQDRLQLVARGTELLAWIKKQADSTLEDGAPEDGVSDDGAPRDRASEWCPGN